MKAKIAIAVVMLVTAISAHAVTGFLVGERDSGMYKICYYDVMGDTVAVTINATKLCPLRMNF